jgi:hypothetical protein
VLKWCTRELLRLLQRALRVHVDQNERF